LHCIFPLSSIFLLPSFLFPPPFLAFLLGRFVIVGQCLAILALSLKGGGEMEERKGERKEEKKEKGRGGGIWLSFVSLLSLIVFFQTWTNAQ